MTDISGNDREWLALTAENGKADGTERHERAPIRNENAPRRTDHHLCLIPHALRV
ncbi:MAG: hypothetical protein IJD43_03070 [Thermoguttaceae bacterium]|nr:hypothetical protein [Thermoguttaceae bacterium]